jgi:signal transduction histidine kinase
MAIPPVNAFAETAALYAVLNEDLDDARRIVSEMHPGERKTLANQLDVLRSLLTDSYGNDIGDILSALTRPRC